MGVYRRGAYRLEPPMLDLEPHSLHWGLHTGSLQTGGLQAGVYRLGAYRLGAYRLGAYRLEPQILDLQPH